MQMSIDTSILMLPLPVSVQGAFCTHTKLKTKIRVFEVFGFRLIKLL
jgi:hypothetical protein